MSSDFVPPLHPDFRYYVDYVGNEKQPVLVVDNFIHSAEILIDVAEKYCHFNESSFLYPGRQALVPPFYSAAIHTHLGAIIAQTFGLKLENITKLQSFYAMVLSPPDTLAPGQSRPHVDSVVTSQLASVHYLCSPDKGGTSLYRHRATGFEVINPEREDEYEHHLLQEENDKEWMGKYINGSNKYYERIGSYDAVFNRIVFYHGNSLHSGNISPDFNFDPNPRTGRLTLTTFIHSRE